MLVEEGYCRSSGHSWGELQPALPQRAQLILGHVGFVSRAYVLQLCYEISKCLHGTILLKSF